jgi:hypothetical protein
MHQIYATLQRYSPGDSMNIYLEVRDYLIGVKHKWNMRGRNASEEMWMFNHDGVEVKPKPKNLPSLLVSIGLAESNSDASRLLKSGSVEWKQWWNDGKWTQVSMKDEIPKEHPFWIRRGKKFYGVKTFMLPSSFQHQGEWEEIVYK